MARLSARIGTRTMLLIASKVVIQRAPRAETVAAPSGQGPGGALQAPHIDVSVFARGLLHRCVTRIYFADEETANAADPILGAVPAERRDTLLAQPRNDGYRFDIRLQGRRETVFFDV